MKKIEFIDKMISMLIVFLTTIVVPTIISNFISNNIAIYLITAIISLLLLIILYLIKLITAQYIYKNIYLKSTYDVMRLYAISSSYWCDLFLNRNIHVNKCILLVRSYVNNIGINRNQYNIELNNAISRWKRLLHEGRINQLAIYSHNNIPDIYYCILDDKLLFTGLNCYDPSDSTGQYGTRKPQTISSNSNNVLINEYIKQFDNYIEKYSRSILYDSTNDNEYVKKSL